MKNYFKLFLISITLFTLSNCKVQDVQVPPTVVTKAASDVTLNSATLNGEVISEGGKATSDRGFVYSATDINPTFSNQKISAAYGIGPFSSNFTNLNLNSTYYFRAYATNPIGTQYGITEKFSTLDAKLPTLSISKVTLISTNSINVDLIITSDGGSKLTETGLVVGTSPAPSVETASFKIASNSSLSSISIESLAENTNYYVRAYAKNIKGISYSDEYSIKTLIDYNARLKNGLVAYYPLNGNSKDVSSNKLDLMGTNVSYSYDRSNSLDQTACVFNGKTSYLIGSSLSAIKSNLSFAIWVKNTRTTAGTWGCIITTQNSTKQGFLLQDNENQKYDFSFANLNGSGYTDVWSASSLKSNEWELIICTYDGNTARIYKNGILETETNIGLKALSSDANLMIGSRYFNEYFKGSLDDIGIWSRVLSVEEINYLSSNSLKF